MMNATDFDPDIRRVAHLMADAARQLILPYFRSLDLQADNKLGAGFDPVTEADRAAEERPRGRRRQRARALRGGAALVCPALHVRHRPALGVAGPRASPPAVPE